MLLQSLGTGVQLSGLGWDHTPFTPAVGKLCFFCWVPGDTDIVSGVKGGLVVDDEDLVGGSGAGEAGHEATLKSGPHGEAGGHWSDSDFHSGVVGGSRSGAGVGSGSRLP